MIKDGQALEPCKTNRSQLKDILALFSPCPAMTPSLVCALLSDRTVGEVLPPGPEVEEEVAHLHVAGQALHHLPLPVWLEDTPAGQDVPGVQSLRAADGTEWLMEGSI